MWELFWICWENISLEENYKKIFVQILLKKESLMFKILKIKLFYGNDEELKKIEALGIEDTLMEMI